MFVTRLWLRSLVESRLSENWVPSIFEISLLNVYPYFLLFSTPMWPVPHFVHCADVDISLFLRYPFMYAIFSHVVCDTSHMQCIIASVIRSIMRAIWSVTITFSNNHNPLFLSVPWNGIIILLCLCISRYDYVWSSFFASRRYFYRILRHHHSMFEFSLQYRCLVTTYKVYLVIYFDIVELQQTSTYFTLMSTLDIVGMPYSSSYHYGCSGSFSLWCTSGRWYGICICVICIILLAFMCLPLADLILLRSEAAL